MQVCAFARFVDGGELVRTGLGLREGNWQLATADCLRGKVVSEGSVQFHHLDSHVVPVGAPLPGLSLRLHRQYNVGNGLE
jgi:hypothetical protein